MTMRSRIAILLSILLAFEVFALGAEPIRVALVAEPGRDAESAVVLAEAELSDSPEIVLLDRQHIRDVLGEQELDAMGLAPPSDRILELGKLLTAQLLAVVEPRSPDGRGVGGLVVYHAATGIRLWNQAIVGENAERQADSIADNVRSCVKKLRDQDGAVCICILPLRNAELPPQWNTRLQTLGKLLERHLVQMPGVAVMERRHLEFALNERRLPTDQPIAPLLASHRFLSIDAERHPGGQGVVLVARLTDEARTDLATLRVASESGDVAELAGRLAEAIAEQLGMDPPAARFDRKAEARRFMFESNYEAAYVLDPEEPLYRQRYIYWLSTRASSGIPFYEGALMRPLERLPFDEEGFERSLTYAEQALDLIDEEVNRQMSSSQWPANSLRVPVGILPSWLWRGIPAIDFMSSDNRRRFEDIIRRYRECQEMWGDRLFAMEKSEDVLSFVNRWARSYLVDLQYVEVFMSEGDDSPFANWSAQWVELLDRHAVDQDEQRMAEALRVVSSLEFWHRSKPISWSPNHERLRPGFKRMAAARSRFVSCYGRMLLVELDRVSNAARHNPDPFLAPRPVDESIDRRLQELIDEAVEEVIREDVPEGIQRLWTSLLARLGYGLSGQVDVPVIAKVVEQLWANNVYGGQLPYHLMNRQRHAKDYDGALETIDRALAMLESRQTEMDSSQCRQEADQLLMQKKFIREQAGRAIANEAPWISVETLFECVAPEKYSGISYQEEGYRAIARPVATESDVYFLAFRFGGAGDHADLVLVRCSLDGKGAAPLGAFRVRRGDSYEHSPHGEPRRFLENSSPVIHSLRGSFSIVDAVVAHGRYYAATQGYGLLVFPLDGSKPWAIDASDGMPLDQVQRIAVYGDDIYAWLSRDGRHGTSHAYFVRISREGKVTDVICSSLRSSSRNMLDGIRPTICYFLMLDAERERLVFGLKSPRSLEHRAIYQFDLRTQAFSKLVDHPRNMSFYTGRRCGNSVLIWGCHLPVGPDGAPRSGNATRGLLSFDLATDSLKEVLTDELRAGSPQVILVQDKCFWTGCPFGRIHRETGKFEPLPPLRPWEFNVLTTMIVVDDTRFLLHDSQSLWLMTLPDERS